MIKVMHSHHISRCKADECYHHFRKRSSATKVNKSIFQSL